jgi:hypothetical protein
MIRMMKKINNDDDEMKRKSRRKEMKCTIKILDTTTKHFYDSLLQD